MLRWPSCSTSPPGKPQGMESLKWSPEDRTERDREELCGLALRMLRVGLCMLRWAIPAGLRRLRAGLRVLRAGLRVRRGALLAALLVPALRSPRSPRSPPPLLSPPPWLLLRLLWVLRLLRLLRLLRTLRTLLELRADSDPRCASSPPSYGAPPRKDRKEDRPLTCGVSAPSGGLLVPGACRDAVPCAPPLPLPNSPSPRNPPPRPPPPLVVVLAVLPRRPCVSPPPPIDSDSIVVVENSVPVATGNPPSCLPPDTDAPATLIFPRLSGLGM